MKPLKKNVSVSLDIDIIEKMKEIADLQERSFSQSVNLVLRSYLNKRESGTVKDSD